MSKERKSTQVVTCISEEDRDWLRGEAARHGLSPSTFIRMTIRRQRAESEGAAGRQMVAA